MSVAEWAVRSQHLQCLPAWLQRLCQPLLYHRGVPAPQAHGHADVAIDDRDNLHCLHNGSRKQEYGGDSLREWYYMQADLQSRLLRDVQLDDDVIASAMQLPLARSDVQPSPSMSWSQKPRLWLSPQGAVSPMHYDKSSSFLVQIVGRKRMVFVDSENLPLLRPFPDEHMLARRAQLPVAGQSADAEASAGLHGAEVVLQPGDALFFAPYWPHYTVSESVSCSVTCRFAEAGHAG